MCDCLLRVSGPVQKEKPRGHWETYPSFTVPGTKVAPFPYLMWIVAFHCLILVLRSFGN